MNYRISNDQTVAVSTDTEWQPMQTAPCGVKVQLLTPYGIAVYGEVNEKNRNSFKAWGPLLKTPQWLKLNG